MERTQEAITKAVEKLRKRVAEGGITLDDMAELMQEVADLEDAQVSLEAMTRESANLVSAVAVEVSAIEPVEPTEE